MAVDTRDRVGLGGVAQLLHEARILECRGSLVRHRPQPGRLVGTGLVLYGLFRIGLETLRQPDYGLEHNWWGLTMGQTLSVPMVIIGIYLFVTAKSRRTRVESIAGQDSVA